MSRDGGKTAVLLMAYGAALTPEDIPAYLSDIMGGRPAPEPLVRDVAERCRRIGGKSPLIDIVRSQAQALESSLNSGGPQGGKISTFIGMLHSEPTIASAVRRISEAGHTRVVAIPMTPFRAAQSDGAYLEDVRLAVEAMRISLEVIAPAPWCENPLLIEALSEKIGEARSRVPASLKGETALLMTGHSLPERLLGPREPYRRDFSATSKAVAQETGFTNWRFAFQSRPVRAPEPWIGPDAGTALEELAAEGVRSVILSPIGYLGENLETLYDDDIVLRAQAEKLGMHFERAAAPNDSPALIEALADVVRSALK